MGSEAQVSELHVQSLQARLTGGEPLVLLDVREDHERDHARIAVPDSGVVDLHVPLGQIPARLDEIVDRARGLPLVVYCHHGQRSMAAATWLQRQGIGDVHNLDGGIDAWSIRVDRAVRRY